MYVYSIMYSVYICDSLCMLHRMSSYVIDLVLFGKFD